MEMMTYVYVRGAGGVRSRRWQPEEWRVTDVFSLKS